MKLNVQKIDSNRFYRHFSSHLPSHQFPHVNLSYRFPFLHIDSLTSATLLSHRFPHIDYPSFTSIHIDYPTLTSIPSHRLPFLYIDYPSFTSIPSLISWVKTGNRKVSIKIHFYHSIQKVFNFCIVLLFEASMHQMNRKYSMSSLVPKFQLQVLQHS